MQNSDGGILDHDSTIGSDYRPHDINDTSGTPSTPPLPGPSRAEKHMNLQNVHIHLQIDNTAAVANVNKMGGLHSKDLCQLALQVWDWCLARNLTISAEHLPGSLNQLADKESRTTQIHQNGHCAFHKLMLTTIRIDSCYTSSRPRLWFAYVMHRLIKLMRKQCVPGSLFPHPLRAWVRG